MTASAPAVADLNFTALPGETIALSARPAPANRPRWPCCTASSIRRPAAIQIDGIDIRDMKLAALRHNIGVVFQETLLFNRSIAENLRVGKPDATEEEMRDAAARAQALEFIERAPDGFDDAGRRARPRAVGRRAPAPVDRARAPQGPADPDSRRGDERARRRDRGQRCRPRSTR